MDKFARTSRENRQLVFQETASRKGTSPQIAEKDFWVCWTLKRLFSLDRFGDYFVFKGGTSLSKVYGVIERFSEDIDVAIQRHLLVDTEDGEFAKMSVKKRDSNVKALDDKCKKLIQSEILKELQTSIESQLGNSGWTLEVDSDDPFGQTILFKYPNGNNSDGPTGLEYVRSIVKIELGARPTNEPSETHSIRPFVAEQFPNQFQDPEVALKVLAAERIFWEKATILHDLFHRQPEYVGRERFSRHYYDLYQLSRHGWASKALEKVEILKSVVANKKDYFYRAGAKYDEALNGRLRLSPNDAMINRIHDDYTKMGEMIFGKPPDFEDILKELAGLEEQINIDVKLRMAKPKPEIG